MGRAIARTGPEVSAAWAMASQRPCRPSSPSRCSHRPVPRGAEPYPGRSRCAPVVGRTRRARAGCRARPSAESTWRAGWPVPTGTLVATALACAARRIATAAAARGLRLQRIYAVRVRASRHRASPRHEATVRSGGRGRPTKRSRRGICCSFRRPTRGRSHVAIAISLRRVRPRAQFAGVWCASNAGACRTGRERFLGARRVQAARN